MNKKDQKLVERFVERIKGLEKVSAAILYGSVARGDYDSRSDIDIMLVVEEKDPMSILHDVTKIITDLKPHREIRCVLTNLTDYDAEFYKNVFKDGKVLFGKLVLSPDHLALRPYLIISYDLKGIPLSKKVKIAQKIYGQRSVKRINGRRYEYHYEGLKDKYGVTVMKKGIIKIPLQDGKRFLLELKKLGIEANVTEVWT
jgi:predicted nucleotidyltransferase